MAAAPRPTTETSWISETGTPRKLICVRGFAVTVPGAGETSTGTPASLALWSSVVGRHAGARTEAVSEACDARVVELAALEPQPATASAALAATIARTSAPGRRRSVLSLDALALVLWARIARSLACRRAAAMPTHACGWARSAGREA